MKHKQPLEHDVARAFYELEPVRVGGFEANFDQAPQAVRRACYDRATATVAALRAGC
ncbi:hypothetical protein EDF38_0143 [Frigoribacterium sp. PhB160]|uniref:hypothetical protein n=1 Tax=Frigoribacterium sp. PhB160 TaxID=2485192 RepID=UPI000F9E8B2D|nr:hypothetical protein [Frigoribacterium sp. PhB160]ROS61064.1 hypothetical protein EDF38_0143 [Frigoribacterium sp. PhB160]